MKGGRNVATCKSFLETWNASRCEVRIGKEVVVFYDLIPDHPTIQDPILIISGWLGQAIAWMNVAEMFWKLRRRVIIVDMPHGVCNTISTRNPLRAPLLRLVTANMAVLDKLDVVMVDVIAHSMGCQVAALMAERCENVRRMALLNPAGLTPWGILLPWRNWKHMKQSMVSAVVQGKEAVQKRKQIDNAVGEAFKRTRFRSILELLSIMFVRIDRRLIALANQGFEVNVIAGRMDKLFPIEGINGLLADTDVQVWSVGGVHDQVFSDPNPKEIHAALSSLLN